MRLVIEGRPVTKKNHTRRIRRGTRTFTVQSEAHERWLVVAVGQLRRQWRNDGMVRGRGPITTETNLRALVYRAAAVGDLNNYFSAICDALQTAGVVADDKLIASFDGSRLLLDRERPRVEITLEPAKP